MTSKSLYISVSPGETRIALKGNGRLCALELERHSSRSIVGNIYLGRVEKIVGGIQAAFIDIGKERSAFLALPELKPEVQDTDNTKDRIESYIKEGDRVVVQVLRDPIAEKGAKLTAHIKLTGRYVVLVPMGSQIRVSHRLRDDETKRLQALLDKQNKDGEGIIVRTAAAAAPESTIIEEIELLRAEWGDIQKKAADETPPYCVFNDLSPMLRNIRNIADHDISEIVIDDIRKHAEVQNFCENNFTQLVKKIKHHKTATPLFEAYDIEDEIDTALSKTVNLSNGARISIEATAALTAIDVDTAGVSTSGRSDETALGANMAAAEEIVRQIRLRNIGGHIVIDAVPMRNPKHQEKLLSTLRQLFRNDSIPTFIAGFTHLRKIELNRQRQQKSLSEMMLANGSEDNVVQYTKTSASVAFEALRHVVQELKTNPGKSFELKASPSVVASLQSGVAQQGLKELNEILGSPLILTEQPGYANDRYDVIVH